MDFRQKVVSHLQSRLKGRDVPLRIRFWDGEELSFSSTPRITLQIHSRDALRRMLLKGGLDGIGEAYVEGDLDMDGGFHDFLGVSTEIASALNGTAVARYWPSVVRRLGRKHSKARDSEAIRYHYDVSNDFYGLWLDRNMVYSCAYFRTGQEDLDIAQEQKLDHICRKLRLAPGERFLDIGCGWGALLIWAARHYGIQGVGVTLSEQQYASAKARVAAEGLAGRVEIRLQDYRDLPEEGAFDKVASVGMFEHVGMKNLPVYFGAIRRVLKEGGLVLNHGITTGSRDHRQSGPYSGDFIDEYVFPDGELPHISEAISEMDGQNLEVLDMESLRPHYSQTLIHWVRRLQAARDHAVAIAGEKRYRIWSAYMAGFAYAFEQGWVSIYQVLAARQDRPGVSPRPWTREYQYNRQAQPAMAMVDWGGL